MKKNAKIYIAGHRGLVGSAILSLLRSQGYENLIFRTHQELDLTRQTEVEAFFESSKPEYVFLAAAKVGGIWANMTYKAEFIYQNLTIAANVIHSARKYGTKKLLNLGSSCIYPRHAPQPMKEEHLLTGSLEPTNEPYAIAKIAAIKLCQYYNEQYGTNFLSVMPTNLYGPHDNFDLESSHVLPALIRKFHLAKLASQGNWEGINKDEASFGKIPADIMANLVAISFLKGFGEKVPPIHRSPSTIHDSPFTNHHSPFTIHHSPPSVLLWGSGSPFREFLHVDDFAAAAVFLMENCDYTETGEFVNVGSGEDHTIAEYAELIKDVVGYDGKILWDKSKPDGMPRKLLDVSRIKTLGWRSKITLRDGIASTYQWYKSKSDKGKVKSEQ